MTSHYDSQADYSCRSCSTVEEKQKQFPQESQQRVFGLKRIPNVPSAAGSWLLACRLPPGQRHDKHTKHNSSCILFAPENCVLLGLPVWDVRSTSCRTGMWTKSAICRQLGWNLTLFSGMSSGKTFCSYWRKVIVVWFSWVVQKVGQYTSTSADFMLWVHTSV